MTRPRRNLRRIPGAAVAASLMAVACASVPGCAAPPAASPFPDVGAVSDAEVLDVLRRRTEPVASAYARIEIAYDGPERDGLFDAVVNWREGGLLRVTAFKDIVVSTRYVFDVLFTPGSYALELYPREGEPTREEGPLAALRTGTSRFAGLAWVGEGLFLAGALPLPGGDPGPEVIRYGDRILVRTHLQSGAPVTWVLEPGTLAVLEARVLAGERDLRLTYDRFRRTPEGVFVPGEVTYADPAVELVMTMRVEELELNPTLDPELFDPAGVGGF